MTNLFIPVILGTAREGRRSENAAKFVVGRLERAGHTAELIDPREYPSSTTDNTETTDAAKRFKEKMEAADAVVIVSPEYNHGYPGELKLLLDMTYAPYDGKPVGLCGVSKGPWGGARCVEQLRGVAGALGLYAIKRTVLFRNVIELFDDEGNMADAERERYEKQVDGLVEHLATYATRLRG